LNKTTHTYAWEWTDGQEFSYSNFRKNEGKGKEILCKLIFLAKENIGVVFSTETGIWTTDGYDQYNYPLCEMPVGTTWQRKNR